MPLLKRPTPSSPSPAPDSNANSNQKYIPTTSDPQVKPPLDHPTLDDTFLEDPSSPNTAGGQLPSIECHEGGEGRSTANDDNMNLISGGNREKDAKGMLREVLHPRVNVAHRSNFYVFNLFGDAFRYLGLYRKKGVQFPEEVVLAAEDKGEISPDGNIPHTDFRYRASYSQKKSKVVRVNRGPEFKPTLPWIANTNKCEVRCERFLTSCNCLGEYQDPKTVLKEKAKKKKHHKRDHHDHEDETPKLSKLTESFLVHVNVADNFLVGHKTRTLTSALEYLDGLDESRANILSKTPSKDSAKSHPEAEKVTSGTGIEDCFEDELPPLSSARLGRLAVNIWMFAICLPFLFSTDDPPSESSYRKLMGELSGLAISANEGAQALIQQSKDFYNYAEEAMRVIRNLQLRIFLQGETNVQPPIRIGGGLQFAKTRNQDKRPPFQILVAKGSPSDDVALEFTAFEDLVKVQKLTALRNLIISTHVEFDTAKHQIDFLVDDIKETTYDTKNDNDLLYRLSEMYQCIIHISAKSEIHPTDNSTSEYRLICENMSDFALSLNSFICASEHVMKKIMEVRDIIQLTYIHLQEAINVDLSKLVPGDTPPNVAVTMGFSKKRKNNCCFGGGSKKGFRPPKYNSSDVFRVFYEDAFESKDCVVDGYVFRVRPSNLSKEAEKQKSLHKTIPKFQFRNSAGSTGGPRLGSSDTIDIDSKDSLLDMVEDIPLKPILKDTLANPTTTPNSGSATDVTEGQSKVEEDKPKKKSL